MYTVGCKVNAVGAGELRVDCGVINDYAEKVVKAFEEIPIVVADLECREFW